MSAAVVCWYVRFRAPGFVKPIVWGPFQIGEVPARLAAARAWQDSTDVEAFSTEEI